jgi:hypothetical protein
MSSAPDDTLYQLLPEVYRVRDALEPSRPLRTLLRAIAAQVDELTADITQVYDNWFIETCDDEHVELLAALVGATLGPALPTGAGAAGAALDGIWRRRQVADAIGDRRRKGTFSVLEQLAGDATGWPAFAVDPATTALAFWSARMPGVRSGRLLDAADGGALDLLATPLSDSARMTDVRRLASRRTPGSASATDVSLWLWRLVADRVDRAPARSVGEDGHYTFDSLGRELPLAVIPGADAPAPPLSELDVPMAITRNVLRDRLEDLYGPGRSLCVYRGRDAVPRSAIVVGDVHRHRRGLEPGEVCLDPVRGRIAFPERYPPEEDVLVSCARLGIGAIGGGSYARPLAPPAAPVYRVGVRAPRAHRTIAAALRAWRDPKKHGGPAAVIEILDDGVYRERFEIELACGESLEIRAAAGCRPILAALERDDARPDRLRVIGPEVVADDEPAPTFTLDGIWVARHPVALHGRLGAVTLRHCTLVPAGALGGLHDGGERRRAPSLEVRGRPDSITVCWSVLGRILAESREVGTEPVTLSVADSVLDASDLTGAAIHGADDRPGWVCAELERVTVLGGAVVHSVSRVRDSLITGALECERRQTGRIGHSHVGPGSRTPRRTLCPEATPRFDAIDFGAPAYARLAREAPLALRRGAHDEGELGAYHDCWETLRIDDLRTQLNGYAPTGVDIDIRLAT